MTLPKVRSLSSLSLTGVVLLTFGLGFAVFSTQQQQDNRSRAAWTGGQCNLQNQSGNGGNICCSNADHIRNRTHWTDVANSGSRCIDVNTESCAGRVVDSSIWLCPGGNNIRCCVAIVPPAPPESTPINPPALPEGTTAFIPYMAEGYKYKQVAHDAESGFEQPSYNDSSFSTGNAGFGTITTTSCPINRPETSKTNWAINTDMLLRKNFTIPQGASNVKLSLAIDDGVKAYINGHEINLGARNSFGTGCANYDNHLVDIPQSFLNIGGDNLIAVRGIDTGVVGFVDLRVYGKVDTVVGSTKLKFDLLLNGIGEAGDSANPDDSDGSNKDPDDKTRDVKVEIRDIDDESLILAKEGEVTYDSASGSYKGEVGIDSGLTNGETYKIWVKLSHSLWNKNTTRKITLGQTYTIPQLTLKNGDANNDGYLNLADYNMIRDCYFDPDIGTPAKNCNDEKKEQADINDDGEVHHFDLSLLLREMSVQD